MGATAITGASTLLALWGWLRSPKPVEDLERTKLTKYLPVGTAVAGAVGMAAINKLCASKKDSVPSESVGRGVDLDVGSFIGDILPKGQNNAKFPWGYNPKLLIAAALVAVILLVWLCLRFCSTKPKQYRGMRWPVVDIENPAERYLDIP